MLAFAKGKASDALWRHWEAQYRTVMTKTRREQPSFQVAVRKAKLEGLRVARLPMIFNCRNVRHCRAVALKDGTFAGQGCTVIHAHDFEQNLVDAVRVVQTAASTSACPPHLSGAHRAVAVPHPPGASRAVQRLYDAFKALKHDNDFSVCGRADDRDVESLPPCMKSSNKYAAVVVGAMAPAALMQALRSRAPVVYTLARLEGATGGFDAKAAAANPQFGPGGKNPVKNPFDGKFSDPAHSGLPRKISTIGGRDYQIEGADEDAKKWVVFAKKKNSNTLIADFTPKGGPEGVVVKAQTNGDLAFPDGNVWKKL